MSRNPDRETRLLTKAGFELARSMHIQRLLVQADELRDIALVEKLRESEGILWVTRSPEPIPGMDEETFQHQRLHQYVVVRQGALYWHDFHFYCDEVEKVGARPWIWSDKYWHDPEILCARCRPRCCTATTRRDKSRRSPYLN